MQAGGTGARAGAGGMETADPGNFDELLRKLSMSPADSQMSSNSTQAPVEENVVTVEKSSDAVAVYNADRPDLITNRGDVTIPVHPMASNGWRGEVEITDHDGGAVAWSRPCGRDGGRGAGAV